MPATEKDLAEDAPWKKIQQNTFTRWCNEHLKCVSKRIANLQTDLSDGLRLIALLEVLSQKKMHRKHNQRPTFRQMQLENVSVALEFLDRESIKLVSIGERSGCSWAPRGRGWGLRASSHPPWADPLLVPLPCRSTVPGPLGHPSKRGPQEQRRASWPIKRANRYAPLLALAQAELTSSTGRAPTAAPALVLGLVGRSLTRLLSLSAMPHPGVGGDPGSLPTAVLERALWLSGASVILK